MRFYADLHVHSKHSVATSRNADLEGLARWARMKGIRVVGTGDFTHPAWFAEIREKLVPAEPGLFRLEPGLDREVERRVPATCRRPVRFALQVEISTIYKKGDRTRKVHHLVYAGDMETAAAFRESLAAVGNISSDGRPILGLDSRHLLEIVLESGPDAFLVPAHVWTPWFAVLGSRSGFDSVEACYGDLVDHVFAVETGLSSDPPMNWRVSGLDRFRLVSNSDAHSPRKLAREACVLETEPEYGAIRRAMETGRGLEGTLEFFPEEGKYHLDGHRKCGVCLEPDRTRALGGACPECGKPVTVGVLHRVEELADRPAGARPQGREPFRSLVPLPEIVAEVRDVGVDTKTVRREVAGLLGRLGPELSVLADLPLEDVEAEADPLVAEGVRRLRAGDVRKEPGFDGRFGVVRLFDPGELRRQTTLGGLLEDAGEGEEAGRPGGRAGAGADGAGWGEGDRGGPGAAPGADTRDGHGGASGAASPPEAADGPGVVAPSTDRSAADPSPSGPAAAGTAGGDAGRILDALDPDQRRAATVADGPLLVVAGPGTGKTRTLTHRIAHQVATGRAAPEACLTLTFTRRAADEMRERLESLVPGAADRIPVTTFHALGHALLDELGREAGHPDGVRVADEQACRELASELFEVDGREARRLLEGFGRLRRERALRAGGEGGHPVPEGSGETGEAAAGGGAPTARGRAGAPGGAAPGAPAGMSDPELHGPLRRWEEALRERGLADFDGLLARPLRLLRERPERREELRARWPRVSIDEYQDVDALQYRLVRLLAPEGSDLCAIGDPDQSIYGFRGAEVGFFLRFREDWPGATVVRLTRSYRSAPAVVEAAGQVIRPASLVGERTLEPVREDGPSRVVVQETRTAAAEAEFVVHTVERLVGGTSYFSLDSGRVDPGESPHPGLSFSDVVVLYRTRDQEPALVEALERAGFPFRRRSHRRLREREDVRALLEAFRGLRGDGAGEGAGHGAGAGDVDAPALLERAAALGGRSGAGGEGGEEHGADGGDGGLDGALRLLRPLAERNPDPGRFLDEVALGAEADAWDPRADRVSLLTLHAAKGLEFPVVFVVGCEDGLLPLRRGGRNVSDDGVDRDEERRLLFVGMTRAGTRLYLTRARRRVRWGEALRPDPSPFLADVDARLLERRRGFGARAGDDGGNGPSAGGGGGRQLELL